MLGPDVVCASGSLSIIGRIDAFDVVPGPEALGPPEALPLIAASLVDLTASGWFIDGPKCVCVQFLVVCCFWCLPVV